MGSLGLLITTYNASDSVKRIVDLVKSNQDILDEIVIVDDCSSDQSELEIRTALCHLKNIQFLSTKTNSGRPSIPRNLGLNSITATRVVFLDCDDWIPRAYFLFLRMKTDRNF